MNNEDGEGSLFHGLFDTVLEMPSQDKAIEEEIAHREEHLLLADRIRARYELICELLRQNIKEEHSYPLGGEDMEALKEFAGQIEMVSMFKFGEQQAIDRLRKTQAEGGSA